MRRREFVTGVVGTAAFSRTVHGQQGSSAIPRIGWLTAQQAASLAPYLDALREGLGELGYRENLNIIIDYRYGNDALERVPELAVELLRVPVQLIVAQGAAVSTINTLDLPIPVIYVFSGDPVSAGLAESLAQPRHNMTGLTFMAAELNSKRLELLREMNTKLQHVALIANPEHPGEHLERSYSEETARRLE